MQNFRTLKQLLNNSEQRGVNAYILLYVLTVYLIFNSFNLTGRLYMQQIYDQRFTTQNSIANVQWFCYYVIQIFTMGYTRSMIKKPIRLVLFLSAMGPQIFLIPGYCATFEEISELTIYLIVVATSIISGFLTVILLMTLVYYVTNLTTEREKIPYFCALFFIHNMQWILGTSIQELMIHYDVGVQQTCYYLIVVQWLLSFLFLCVPNAVNPRMVSQEIAVMNAINDKTAKSKAKSQIEQLRQLIISMVDTQDDEVTFTDLDVYKQNLTIQCLTLSPNTITQMLDTNTFQIYNQSYGKNILYTLKHLDSVYYVFSTIFTVALIEAFLYTELTDFLISYVDNLSLDHIYFYVGLGYILGCFSMGIFGDLKDKFRYYLDLFRWIIFNLCLLQFGLVLAGLMYQKQEMIAIYQSFAIIVGFCCSGLLSTLVMIISHQYAQLIYMIDVIYIFYALSFAVSSLLLIIADYYGAIIIFALLQTLEISDFISLFQYYQIKKA